MNIYFLVKQGYIPIKNWIILEQFISSNEFHLILHTCSFVHYFSSHKSILSNYRFYLRKKEMSRKI